MTSLSPGDAGPVADSRTRRRAALERALAHAAHLLPAQGPIPVFVHHNTLHAFEEQPFEQAVIAAADLFGCEPYLSEDRYRAALASGRIRPADLEATLLDELGDAAHVLVAGLIDRLGFRLAVLRHGVEEPAPEQIEWMAAELGWRDGAALWRACSALADALPAPAGATAPPVRHRDALLAVTGQDSDALVHPLLGRLCAAFLDQGVAYWPMPGRQAGFYHAVQRLYGQAAGPPDPWLARARRILREQRAAGLTAEDSVLESLARLGVTDAEWEPFLVASLLALRGWAGMMHQLEVRPDRAPVAAMPARLMDFVAVRLVLERAALAHLAEAASGRPVDLARLRPREPVAGPPILPSVRAFQLFQLARALDLDANDIAAATPAQARALIDDLLAFPSRERRRVWHLAYERTHAAGVLDALALHTPYSSAPAPAMHAIFCIDEREESLRRHLEEVAPAFATYGTAGYFGVAAYFRSPEQAHALPLCPAAIRPRHLLEEVIRGADAPRAQRSARLRAWIGHAAHALFVGSRTLARGAFLTALFGLGAAVPLVFRVLFPRHASRLSRRAERFLRPALRTRLMVRATDPPAHREGAQRGYTVEEMAVVVGGVLEEVGLPVITAPLVLVIGHGSTSLNNPHESAHDCGACGGGRGGPNARAFAAMANDPEVRALLAQRGIRLAPETAFVGAMHNTCDDAMEYYDADTLGPTARAAFAEAAAALAEACRRNAHERCRRFESCDLDISPREALAHVEERAHDLAQPRPEYGHATNAVCVVGRRRRTRGLFLDRRAFLVSYDPTRDDLDANVLRRVLASAVPVVAGINLEYYFSFVDPTGYGCGTKLPHNVSGLLGVMDGHASDLRPGLPWQMVEIHEPVRLLVVVETTPATCAAVLAAEGHLRRLVDHGWIRLALLDPESPRIWTYEGGRAVPYAAATRALRVRPSSLAWYRGRRDHLPCARIQPAGPAPARTS